VSALARLTGALGRLLGGPEGLEVAVTPAGLQGEVAVPSVGDGGWRLVTEKGRTFLTPDEQSYYLYFVLPPEFRSRARSGLWVEIEYLGEGYAPFRVQYASRERTAEHEGLYKAAEQRFRGEAQGLRMLRRAVFPLPDFDPERTQNNGASFRVEFRSEVLIARAVVHLKAPDLAEFPATAPLPDLKKLPGRFYPINYLFIEITNACNFKCTWCPDDIMGRRRGFMKKEKAFRILDEVARKRSWLGPLYPVKLHQMGEPMLHPDLAAIVEHAESQGVPIELNTNCGLITEEKLDGLYQVALGARTHLEIDIMNTKYADGYRIVSEDEQALAFLEDWVSFAQELEKKYGLPPRAHDWEKIRSFHFLDQDENGSRYELLDGVHLIWKRCHSWGNVIQTAGASGTFDPSGHQAAAPVPVEPPRSQGDRERIGTPEFTSGVPKDTYCPAPYDQLVIQWNGDVTTCCTDYEGRTKTANVFAESIEGVWTGETLRRRKRDMLEGRLLDVCAKCMGIEAVQ
jgi:organic radical activating enzyme